MQPGLDATVRAHRAAALPRRLRAKAARQALRRPHRPTAVWLGARAQRPSASYATASGRPHRQVPRLPQAWSDRPPPSVAPSPRRSRGRSHRQRSLANRQPGSEPGARRAIPSWGNSCRAFPSSARPDRSIIGDAAGGRRFHAIEPSARIRARAWISFWLSTTVAGRTRSMIERTNGRIAGLVSMQGISPPAASRS